MIGVLVCMRFRFIKESAIIKKKIESHKFEQDSTGKAGYTASEWTQEIQEPNQVII